MCRMSESTDPRDKIYGIHGIAAELEARDKHNYRPDYTLTVAEVYTTSTAFVIKSRDDLACLSLVCDSSRKGIENLPSWCPDYSAPIVGIRSISDTSPLWNLGLYWLDAQSLTIIENSILRVDGALFGYLADTSTLLKGLPDNPMNHSLDAVLNLATYLEPHEEKAI